MIEVCGKQVRDTLEELLDPAISALLIIDMQVGGVSKAGAIADAGHDISMMGGVRERCGAAIEAARRHGVPVFHVRVANLPGQASSPAAWLQSMMKIGGDREIDLSRLSIEGDPATEFCEECMPLEGEVVITKRRPSAFFGTDLTMLLRAQGIESVAVVGVSTGGCVEATVRDATHNDFYAVLLEDAVGAYNTEVHEAALTVMRARHNHCTVDEAIAAWAAGSGDRSQREVAAVAR
jgi:nicotinamidase-related amidase